MNLHRFFISRRCSLVTILCIASAPALAPASAIEHYLKAEAPPRYALLFGASTYRGLPRVESAHRDIEVVEAALTAAGFTVLAREADADADTIFGEVDAAVEAISNATREEVGAQVLIYLIGHGARDEDNVDYFFARTVGESPSFESDGVAINALLERLNQSVLASIVLVIDACRTRASELPDPDGYSNRVEVGSNVAVPLNAVALFSATPGDTANIPAPEGSLSPFAAAFARELIQEDVFFADVASTVAGHVHLSTAKRQLPDKRGFLKLSLRPGEYVKKHDIDRLRRQLSVKDPCHIRPVLPAIMASTARPGVVAWLEDNPIVGNACDTREFAVSLVSTPANSDGNADVYVRMQGGVQLHQLPSLSSASVWTTQNELSIGADIDQLPDDVVITRSLSPSSGVLAGVSGRLRIRDSEWAQYQRLCTGDDCLVEPSGLRLEPPVFLSLRKLEQDYISSPMLAGFWRLQGLSLVAERALRFGQRAIVLESIAFAGLGPVQINALPPGTVCHALRNVTGQLRLVRRQVFPHGAEDELFSLSAGPGWDESPPTRLGVLGIASLDGDPEHEFAKAHERVTEAALRVQGTAADGAEVIARTFHASWASNQDVSEWIGKTIVRTEHEMTAKTFREHFCE